MKTYRLNWNKEKDEHAEEVFEVGTSVLVEGEYIKILSILKIDTEEQEMWFTGVPESDLSLTQKINE